ncbi:hypothetical protein PR202_ga11113 [Eleusine coracana subsp. coracana]|uniref:Uncharacterized protein n=1 Tax=Eleusine coracana subsp. coracana TaxID=191504 RepID=A0AAV5C8Q3_ELECO|nr:hypothetical protein PR202_ga11113 [Eleusine coracana subsp. coracana]
MAFDPNNPPGFGDKDIPAVKGAAGDAALLDLNSPAYEDIPSAAQGQGGPYGIMECNMAPDLDDEANIASDPEEQVGLVVINGWQVERRDGEGVPATMMEEGDGLCPSEGASSKRLAAGWDLHNNNAVGG